MSGSRRSVCFILCLVPLMCLLFGCGKKEEESSKGTYYEGKDFVRPGSGGGKNAKSDNS